MDYQLKIPGHYSGTQLIKAIAMLPPGTKSLDLSNTDLNRFTAADLIMALNILPKSVASLNLSTNRFGEFKSSDELANIMKAIPQTVTHLHLNNNFFGHKTQQELQKIFGSLHEQLIELNLYNNDLSAIETELEFYTSLPQGIRSIANTVFSLHLINQIQALVNENNIPALAHRFIYTSKKIYADKIDGLLQYLKQDESGIAKLTCGLLLEGRIATYGRFDLALSKRARQNAINKQMEIRAMAAIDFYIEASLDPALRIIADFILWHLKTTTDIPPVKEKLLSVAIPPPVQIFSSYCDVNAGFFARRKLEDDKNNAQGNNWEINPINGN